jgi:beta-N-acetylhexosaminidase
MNALKGTLGERAKAIAENGCDIVLHCNGVMDEMLQVIEAVRPLEGKSRERARRVEAAFGKIDGSEEAAIRAEFNALLPAV